MPQGFWQERVVVESQLRTLLPTGVFFPSLASLCSQRVVEGERGLLMSLMHGGCHLGYVALGVGARLRRKASGDPTFASVRCLSGHWWQVGWGP